MIRVLFVALLVPTVIAPNLAFAQREDMLTGFERYAPEQAVAGTIRIEGNNYAKGLVNLWQEGFHKFYPSVRFETSLKGSETGIAALYVGAADITFLGREIYRSQEAAFVERFGYPPLGFDTTTGSYDRPHMTFALMVFVHASNPLSRISFSQVERVFRCMEGGEPIRTWGELGLKGEEWKNRPIHIYSYGADSGFCPLLTIRNFQKQCYLAFRDAGVLQRKAIRGS